MRRQDPNRHVQQAEFAPVKREIIGDTVCGCWTEGSRAPLLQWHASACGVVDTTPWPAADEELRWLVHLLL